MGKKEKSVIAVYVILLLIFNVVYLGIPFSKTAVSWIAYAFTLVSFIVSFLVTAYAFKGRESIKSSVYSFPIFRVGCIYAGIQLAFCILICLCALFIKVPNWIPCIVSIILLGAAMIGVIAADNTRDVVEQVEEQILSDTRKITYFRLDVSSLISSCQNSEIKKELERLAEEARYSDPVSNHELAEIEEQIIEELKVLKNMLQESNIEDLKKEVQHIMNMLQDRNVRCKALKNTY